ncbi:hypothetical protein H8S90_12530 [Olivibacter sp. SDN3]|uniref:DUF6266 family protein n=1 Tax=Olivibacter sp. SDN3 TaxID=2764720 RepID=UPI00165122E6|nr:DUF6266 family protein [Olivibacter sp. SDN3]QNL52317.1 hypothetical protein H8S90_12530 [Olivibacter sp. SDN3]
MGILNKGANGPFRGKTGSVIGSGWKKIDYIKGLPRSYKNKGKPSVEQQFQQQKFQLLNSFLSFITPVLKIGFQAFLSKATARNIAFQYNYEHAFIQDETGEPALNYAALRLSHGSLFSAGAENAEWVENSIRVSWDPKTYGISGALDDEAHMLCYFANANFFKSPENLVRRHHGEAQIPDVSQEEFQSAHIWLFFSDNQRKRVSSTVYLPTTKD